MLNLGTLTEGNDQKKILMRGRRLNSFGEVWSNIIEVITKLISNLHWVRNLLVINLEHRVGFRSQFLAVEDLGFEGQILGTDL